MRNLVNLVSNSQDPEFENLRKIVKEKKKLTKEELLKINPLIFLKDKRKPKLDMNETEQILDIRNFSNKFVFED